MYGRNRLTQTRRRGAPPADMAANAAAPNPLNPGAPAFAPTGTPSATAPGDHPMTPPAPSAEALAAVRELHDALAALQPGPGHPPPGSKAEASLLNSALHCWHAVEQHAADVLQPLMQPTGLAPTVGLAWLRDARMFSMDETVLVNMTHVYNLRMALARHLHQHAQKPGTPGPPGTPTAATALNTPPAQHPGLPTGQTLTPAAALSTPTGGDPLQHAAAHLAAATAATPASGPTDPLALLLASAAGSAAPGYGFAASIPADDTHLGHGHPQQQGARAPAPAPHKIPTLASMLPELNKPKGETTMTINPVTGAVETRREPAPKVLTTAQFIRAYTRIAQQAPSDEVRADISSYISQMIDLWDTYPTEALLKLDTALRTKRDRDPDGFRFGKLSDHFHEMVQTLMAAGPAARTEYSEGGGSRQARTAGKRSAAPAAPTAQGPSGSGKRQKLHSSPAGGSGAARRPKQQIVCRDFAGLIAGNPTSCERGACGFQHYCGKCGVAYADSCANCPKGHRWAAKPGDMAP